MQLAPQATLDALAGATWHAITSLEPDGVAHCQCIRTEHASGLYVTRDGIITHNSTPPNFLEIARQKMQDKGDANSSAKPKVRGSNQSGFVPKGGWQEAAKSAIADIERSTRGLDGGQNAEAREVRRIAEARALYRWAVENNRLIKEPIPPKEKHGAEHDVWFPDSEATDPKKKAVRRAWKATNRMGTTLGFGLVPGLSPTGYIYTIPGNPVEYLKRLELSNRAFKDDVRFEGIAIEDGSMRVIISQKILEGGKPTPEIIRDWMKALNFHPIGDYRENRYYNPDLNIAAFDAHTGNFIGDSVENLQQIDLVLSEPTGAFRKALENAIKNQAESGTSLRSQQSLPDIPSWNNLQAEIATVRQDDIISPEEKKSRIERITLKYKTENPTVDDLIAARKEASKLIGKPIPPAWTNVEYFPDSEKLLVKGRDAKGRNTAIYSSKHEQQQLAEKFARNKRVDAEMPKILEGIRKGIIAGDEEASVLRLIYLSGFRNGGEGDGNAKTKAYGASTLMAEHVTIDGNLVTFDFIGKLGVRQQHAIVDAGLASDLSERKKRGGKLFNTDATKVLAYFKKISGNQDFIVHDLRTWNATELAKTVIKQEKAPQSSNEYWNIRDDVADIVARKLGDTREIVLGSYIDPIVFAEWAENAKINSDESRPKRSKAKADVGDGQSPKIGRRTLAEYERTLRDELLPSSSQIGSARFGDGRVGQISLFSQAAPIAPERLKKLDDLEARAAQEVDGNRTVGDPRLAHAADSTQWMAFDELRKAEFEKQRERDWQAVAERMVRDDYDGVKEALLDAAATGAILTPVQTKAAQILIAAESAKPRTPERRIAIYQLIEAYRATGAEAGRSLSARKDPHRTPMERWKAFFAEKIYTPPSNVRRTMEKAIWERQKNAEIARLRAMLEGNSQASAAALQQAREDLARVQTMATKESIMKVDYDARVKKIEAALAKMGVTLDDIFNGEIRLSLMGAAIVKNTLANYQGKERAVLRDLQGKRGGNISDIAKRHGITRQEVVAIQEKAMAELREKILEKTRRGITRDKLEKEGLQEALLSQGTKAPPTEEEAQREADAILRMMGFFGKDHDRIKIRQPRKAKPVAGTFTGPVPSTAPVPPTPINRQPGLDLPPGEFQRPEDWEYLPPAEKRLWAEKAATMPMGEGRVDDLGKLDLEDNQPWTGAVAYKLDPESLVDMLHVKRVMDIADGNHSWVDYATEIGIANLLSAPVTFITNLTGFAYSAYEMTVKKAFRASYNSMVKKSADADQWEEFRAMGEVLAPAIARAWVNAKNAWATESPLFEKQVLDQETEFSFMDTGIRAHIAGKKGRLVRAPFRLLLASDEFMKTILGTTHAAAIALRSGKARGLSGKALESFMANELGERGSRSWNIATQEAQRLTFQTKLRSIREWDKMRDEGELSPAAAAEFALRGLNDFKNRDAYDANVGAKLAILVARMFFPFIRTPYRLLELGLNETLLGAGNSLLLARGKSVLRDAKGKIITHDMAGNKLPAHDLKGDAAKVAAAATAIHAAMFTLAMLYAGEGDDDDDDKAILFSGSAFGEDKEITPGLRQHMNRTMPPYSIRIGGKNGWVISYQRLDPFSTAIATTVDWLKNIKQAAAGKRSVAEGGGKIVASLYSQILDKASLRGFSQLADLASGTSSLPEWASKQIAAWSVPNLIRNPARNSDPYVRETKALNPLTQIPYQMFPVAAIAPPARQDVFGEPMRKEGSFVSRTLVPGNPRPAPAPNPFDVALRKYNLRNPNSAYAPVVPKNTRDRDEGSFKYTPAQYERFTKARGQIFRSLLTEAGYMQPGRRLREEDIQEIKRLGSKATSQANKMLGR